MFFFTEIATLFELALKRTEKAMKVLLYSGFLKPYTPNKKPRPAFSSLLRPTTESMTTSKNIEQTNYFTVLHNKKIV